MTICSLTSAIKTVIKRPLLLANYFNFSFFTHSQLHHIMLTLAQVWPLVRNHCTKSHLFKDMTACVNQEPSVSMRKSRLVKSPADFREGRFQTLKTQKAICWYLKPLRSGFHTSQRDDKTRRRVCVKSNRAKHWNRERRSPNMTSLVSCVLASPSLTHRCWPHSP